MRREKTIEFAPFGSVDYVRIVYKTLATTLLTLLGIIKTQTNESEGLYGGYLPIQSTRRDRLDLCPALSKR